MASPTPILLPVEVQSRELDAKLLLASVAAERGHTIWLGCRTRLHRFAHRLPPSIYLGKGLTRRALKSFQAMGRLGHRIAAWDEEGLVYMTPDMYRRRKLSPATLARPELLFAWGEDNAEIWRASDGYRGQPIVVSGNPRADMMRPELRAYHAETAERLRERFGRFVLVNSSFGAVNHWVPGMSGATEAAEVPPELVGTAKDPAMNAHRRRLLDAFLAMLPPLADALASSGRRLIVRPHPSESHEAWVAAGQGRSNIEILHEGAIIPWLLAAEAVVHNGCQTAVEAFLLDRPVIAYRPHIHELYEIPLPNMVSREARTLDELVDILEAVEDLRPSGDAARTATMRRHVAAMDGAFAADRIVDALAGWVPASPPSTIERITEIAHACGRSLRRTLGISRGQRSGHERYLAHIFPDLTVEAVEARIGRLAVATGRFATTRVEPVAPNIFKISA